MKPYKGERFYKPDMKVMVCTQGSVGISVVRKLFELRFRPDDITIVTYDTDKTSNKPLVDFLNFFGVEWFVTEGDMVTLAGIIESRKINLLLSISYKYIFKDPILGLSDVALINLHPGLLPHYKGFFSTSWSIINNESYVGYTYHKISPAIDGGDIIYQEKFPIYPNSTAFDLHFTIMNAAVDRLREIIFTPMGVYPQIGDGCYYGNTPPEFNPMWNSDKIERYKRAIYFPPHDKQI